MRCTPPSSTQTASGRPKTEVLARLAEQAAPGTRLVFVEDKLSTLAAVAKTPGFEAWELFLGACEKWACMQAGRGWSCCSGLRWH
jgi:hypothetical protein